MKRLLIPLFIALVLTAGCLGAGNTPNSGGLPQGSTESHQMVPTPPEDVINTKGGSPPPPPPQVTAQSRTVE